MEKNYMGCDNAASATAKIVSTSTYDYSKRTTYFGNLDQAINSYAISVKVDEGAKISLHYFEFFVKDMDTKKWVEMEIADEVIESIWASSPVNPANKPVTR